MRKAPGSKSLTVQPIDMFWRLYLRTVKGKPGRAVWFCRAGDCRFDVVEVPKGIPPGGTCYLSESEEGAYLEVFGRFNGRAVTEDDLAERRLAVVRLSHDTQAYDMTSPANFSDLPEDVRHETGPQYPKSQEFAAALYAANWGGIWWISVKHPPAQCHNLAAFSEYPSDEFESCDDPNSKFIEVESDGDVPMYLGYEACDKYGIKFARNPRTYARR
ncbi:RES family NAD+ phosphorylase [Streptomyces sp. NPDC058548]|uniref:RES family NAD+ phosphorylase n=1 Tax=Streptomyces sp. NPDC058548 TaxID=3346545 RepID=UPI0036662E0D